MTCNLTERLERDIISAARRFGVRKVILFDSRARGKKFDVVNLDDDLAADFLVKGGAARREKIQRVC